jgi:hypothetical protein
MIRRHRFESFPPPRRMVIRGEIVPAGVFFALAGRDAQLGLGAFFPCTQTFMRLKLHTIV